MKAKNRLMARRHLDKRFHELRLLTKVDRPPCGWVKAIREALGITTAQLGKRIGVSQPRTVAIEKAEAKGAITLDMLERAAQALDCRVVYALVPKQPLNQLIEEKAWILAREQLRSIRHTMRLEDQAVDINDDQEQLKDLVRKLVEQSNSKLWEV